MFPSVGLQEIAGVMFRVDGGRVRWSEWTDESSAVDVSLS